MAHDPAVTRHAADRREAHGSAVDELGPPNAIRERVDVGNEVQGVAIGIRGARRSVELPVAGSDEVEQGVDPTLPGPCGQGFS